MVHGLNLSNIIVHLYQEEKFFMLALSLLKLGTHFLLALNPPVFCPENVVCCLRLQHITSCTQIKFYHGSKQYEP